MRVATFNILHGRTVGDGVKVQRLRDCVRRLDPDVWPPSPVPPGRRGWLPRVTSNPGPRPTELRCCRDTRWQWPAGPDPP